MNKKYSSIILALIIIIQLAVPVTMLTVSLERKKEFDNNCREIKLSVDSISCEEDYFGITRYQTGEFYEWDYITFLENENGYATLVSTEEKPADLIYIPGDSFPRYLEFKKKEMPEGYEYYDLEYYYLYDSENEDEYLKNHSEPYRKTEAYMILKVYDGMYEIKDVFIDGVPLEECYKKAESGEYSLERHNYFYDIDYDVDVTEYYDESIGEYVTEPFAA